MVEPTEIAVDDRYRFTDNEMNRDMRMVGEVVTIIDIDDTDDRTLVSVEYDLPTARDSPIEVVDMETFIDRVENGGLEKKE